MPFERHIFLKNLTYAATAPTDSIFQDLNQITHLDRWAKSQQKKFSIWLIISFGAVVIFLFWVPFLSPLAIIAAIYCLIMFVKFKSINIDNLRYQLTKKILSVLHRDRNKNQDVRINLIFSSPTKKNKKISKTPHPYRKGWQLELFQDQWLNLTGEFIDGTKFQLILTDIYRVSSGWKRSRSGKYKHKSKTKFKGSTISLNLKYLRRKYGAIEVLKQEAPGAIKLPKWSTVKNLKITDKALTLTVKSESKQINILYQTIISMFLSLYQILNLAKMLSKRK